MTSTDEKQKRFYESLDYEKEELPGIAKKSRHYFKETDVGKYKNEHLKKVHSFVDR